MSRQEILERAISKAIDGGWTYLGYPENGWGVGTGQWHTGEHHLTINHHKTGDQLIHRNQIIFNHDFAKALWNRKGHANMYYTYPVGWDRNKQPELSTTTAQLEEWQFHLQQMVIADDPIAYLGENI